MNVSEIRQKFNEHIPAPMGRHRFFSVLVPFVEKEGKMYLLYEVRAKDIADPGEICFPGGHMEKDETPEECALRETAEELGIPTDKVEIVSRGDTLFGYAGYTLFSTIGIISYEDYLNIEVQKMEVDSVFLVDAEFFKENKPERHGGVTRMTVEDDFPYESLEITTDYKWRQGWWDIPIYTYEDKKIWGITARVTESVANTLFPISE